MAVGPVHSPHPRRRWLDALFGEAFELEHRRRRRQLLAALLVCVAAVSVAAGLRTGHGAVTASGSGSSVRLSSGALVGSGNSDLWAVGRRLLVTGGKDLIHRGYGVSSLVDGRVAGVCSAATVDPLSLRVLSTARANCGDPALYGQHVLPVSYVYRMRTGLGTFTLALRVAKVAPRAPGGYRLGPIVVRYPQCSDCGVGWIVGDGSLWVYAPLSTPYIDKHVGELFRISERSGRVLQHWRMPVFTRALLATDTDGIWIAQSFGGGVPEGVTRSQRLDYESIYRVAPGMRAPERVRRIGSWGANWLLASGHSVWIDVDEGRKPAQLWRLDGAAASPVISSSRVPSSSDCVQTGELSGPLAGNPAAGIYCQNVPTYGPTARTGLAPPVPPLQSFNPTTGADHAIHVPAIMGSSVALGSSVYFLGASPLGSRTRIYRLGG